jgi:hypothetical protein
MTLGAIFTSETAFYADRSRFGSFQETGYALSGVSNRYTYRSPASGGNAVCSETQGIDVFASSAGSYSTGGSVVSQTGIFLQAGATVVPAAFTATATGNVDADPVTDEWHINDRKEQLAVPDQNDAAS